MRTFFMIFGAALCLPVVTCARTWTDARGRKVEAEFGGETNGLVKLTLPGGKTVDYPLKDLSAADQKFVADQRIPEPAPEPVPATENFPVFDFGVPKVETAREASQWLHTWGTLAIQCPMEIQRAKFEKTFRPVLGVGRVLESLGLPQSTLPSAKQPLFIRLLASADDVAKAADQPQPSGVGLRTTGRIFGSIPFFDLGDGQKSGGIEQPGSADTRIAQASVGLHLRGWKPFLPGWIRAGIEEYANMLPMEKGWPQTAHARVAMKKVQASLVEKRTFIITPTLIDEVLSQPLAMIGTGESDRPHRTASLLTLFYLRHIHGDGKGEELRKSLAVLEPKVAAWLAYLSDAGRYEEVWEQIKADPSTIKEADGSYRFSSSYEVPITPQPPIEISDREAIIKGIGESFNTIFNGKAGETVITGLIKAGFTQGIAVDPAQIASFYQSGKAGEPGGYQPRDLTPDYSKARAPRPHPPIDQRAWPVSIVMGSQPPMPTQVASTGTSATYRLGNFEFETGPDLSVPLVREVGRVFVGMEEIFQRLPWDLPPIPPEGGKFRAKLYADVKDYAAIAPPLTSGFYSIKDKLFHVPYASLGMERDDKGRWSKTKDFNPDTLMHEITHMMMDHVVPVLPIWVAEGAAEYVETLPMKGGAVVMNEMPKALKDYILHMEGFQTRANSNYRYRASVSGLLNVLHITGKAWHNSVEQGRRVKPTMPSPAIARPATANTPPTGVLQPTERYPKDLTVKPVIVLPPDRQVVPVSFEPRIIGNSNDRAAMQHDLYMHSCLLFYYFMHLDNPARRGDPMLTFIDKASDFIEQFKLYEAAGKEYEKLFSFYRDAWDRFSLLPGVTRTGEGHISYPSHMVPPQPPDAPRAPFDKSKLPDEDITLSNLDTLIKGRTDDQLNKAFREGFARIGITIE
ncbi:MAG: hypothetical protein JNM99_21395 [Verrucomicrobiaceae bacterium]|nr:hypothetical protein [Verrucomicrobiaceae bacterium]